MNIDTPLEDGLSPEAEGLDQVRSPYLLRIQRRVALAVIVIPTIGAACAVVMTIRYGLNSWDIAMLLVMHCLTMLGITVGYHRMLAHKAFQCGPIVRSVLMGLGAMAGQGPPINWVSNHRLHHRFSDEDRDLHSPNAPDTGVRGFVNSHLFWMMKANSANPSKYARDLLADPLVRNINAQYWAIVAVGVVLPGALGALVVADAVSGFAHGVVWGGLCRMFTVHHATWCINSVTHRFGAREFRTDDQSTNVSWLAPISAGEAWHNAHHAFPRSARFGLSWWQFDLGWICIRLLEKLGLATAVYVPSREVQARKRIG